MTVVVDIDAAVAPYLAALCRGIAGRDSALGAQELGSAAVEGTGDGILELPGDGADFISGVIITGEPDSAHFDARSGSGAKISHGLGRLELD